jgi:hypothetical protein
MGSTKSKWRGGQLAFYDNETYETVKPIAPQYLYDDFLGTALNADIWTGLDVAGGTLAAPVLSYWAGSLAANNENQAAGVYGRDTRCWSIDKGCIFECRLATTTNPAGTTEVQIGLIGESYGADSMRVAEADEIDIHALFVMDGGMTIEIYADDAGTDHNAVATGVTPVTSTYNIFRIDCTDAEDVKFYIDGAQVASTTTFDMSTGSITWQPWVVIYKHDNVNGLGVIRCDYIRLWQASR